MYLRRLCSDVTLVSNKDGFFVHWIDQISSYISDDFVQRFGKLSTDYDRIQMAWKIKPVHSLTVKKFYRVKDEKSSIQFRDEGNTSFRNKNLSQALLLYCRAVTRAPHSGSSLCLAYANRSAALCQLAEYRWCLRDIRLALLHGYPSNLHYKVLERAGHCYDKLSHTHHAVSCFRKALTTLPNSGLDPGAQQTWNKNITKKLDACVKKQEENKKMDLDDKGSKEDEKHEGHGSKNFDDDDVLINDSENISVSDGKGVGEAAPHQELFRGPSPVLPSASAAITLESSPEAGRSVVAKEDVPAGELLVSEEPFAAVLARDKTGSYCSHCFRRLMAPVPCPECCGVAYCCQRCHDDASVYHRWECVYLELLHGSGMSLNCYLSLRIITKHPLQYFTKLRPQLKKSKLLEGTGSECSGPGNVTKSVPLMVPTASHPHDSSSYLSVYHTVALHEQRDPYDFLQRSLMAILLLKVLQRTGYFGSWDEEIPADADAGDVEVFIGALLLRNLQVLQFNAHEVSGMTFLSEPPTFQQSKSFYLGLAIYTTVAFFNHSCYPAVARHFHGSRMLVSSIRTLKKGEVVCENYGPIFTHHSLEQRRRKLLSRYWFKCVCIACEEDWKTFGEQSSLVRFKCPSCSKPLPAGDAAATDATTVITTTAAKRNTQVTKCPHCKKRTVVGELADRMAEVQKLFHSGKHHMDCFKREAAISQLTQYVSLTQQLTVLPNGDLHRAMEALRLLVATRGTCATVLASTTPSGGIGSK